MTPAPDQLLEFARRYTDAWCSQDPARVAENYAPDGSSPSTTAHLSGARRHHRGRPIVHGRLPGYAGAHGRPRRTRRQRRIPLDARRNEHGPGGTGHRVRISGFEEWTIGDDGLIASSLGHYDQAEYDRQVEHGVEEPRRD